MTQPAINASPLFFPLPRELSDQVISNLDYHDLLSLRQVCQSTSFLIPFSLLKSLRLLLKQALVVEEQSEHASRELKYNNMVRWARAFPQENRQRDSSRMISNIHTNTITKATWLNCYACLKRLPRECFTDSQVTGSRSLGHKNSSRRFCKLCGVRKGIWERGTTVKETKCTWLVCKTCGSIMKADTRYKRARVCSAECLDLLPKDKEQQLDTKGSENLHLTDLSSPGLGSNPPIPKNARTTSRATRCLRCWSIDHTEKIADGELGLHLCKSCEALVGHERTGPSAEDLGV